MEVGDIHVGKQLNCVFTPQGLNPTAAINPFGAGELAVCGTGHFNGGVLIGSGKIFASPKPTAALMVTRPSPDEVPLATAPSIVHIRGLPLVSTPIDVVIGDPLGPVGITMDTTVVVEINKVSKKTISPLEIDIITLMKKLGTQVNTGAQSDTGVVSQAGAEVRASAKSMAGPVKVSGPLSAPIVKGSVFTGRALGNKSFDIEHPTKSGWRLRHTCVEGPENAVFFRGKLDGTHIIEFPEYWKGLIKYDTISVNLTPFGRTDDLYVKDIQEDRIIIAGNHLTNIQCFYQVWADRMGESLIAEYEGESPSDYPGDNSAYSVAGHNYDVRSK